MKPLMDMMDKIDALSVRERGAIFVAVLAVIFFVWDSYLMASLDSREKMINAQLQQKQAERAALNAELQVLINKQQNDPAARNKARLTMLRQQLQDVRAEVLKSTRHLVAPGNMASVLEAVLSRTEGLELVRVKGLGATSLVGAEKDRQQATDASGATSMETDEDETDTLSRAYKHGLEIVFNGSFMSTLEYVRKLEQLESEFIWDSLQLKITEYPEGEVSITFFTLSLDRNWIGV